MCLVLIGWQQLDDMPLIDAGNRDEFHARPTQEMHWWPDKPDLLAGRDLEAGGTWLAVGRSGRFATVTNYRDMVAPRGQHRSRGELVTHFVEGDMPPADFIADIDGDAYAGFNLFVSDRETLAFSSNRGDVESRVLEPGIYGLANAELDAPWHKTEISRRRFSALIESEGVNPSRLLKLLDDRERGPADDVSTNGLDFDRAHALTAPFIVQPEYGTRSSTVIVSDQSGLIDITERRFRPDGGRDGDSRVTFHVA